jgi:hypothetical protein
MIERAIVHGCAPAVPIVKPFSAPLLRQNHLTFQVFVSYSESGNDFSGLESMELRYENVLTPCFESLYISLQL